MAEAGGGATSWLIIFNIGAFIILFVIGLLFLFKLILNYHDREELHQHAEEEHYEHSMHHAHHEHRDEDSHLSSAPPDAESGLRWRREEGDNKGAPRHGSILRRFAKKRTSSS